jgi:hypothetical protein
MHYSWDPANCSSARVTNEANGIVSGRRPTRRKLLATIAKALIAHISIERDAARGENCGAFLRDDFSSLATGHFRNEGARFRMAELLGKGQDNKACYMCFRSRRSHSVSLLLDWLIQQELETLDCGRQLKSLSSWSCCWQPCSGIAKSLS